MALDAPQKENRRKGKEIKKKKKQGHADKIGQGQNEAAEKTRDNDEVNMKKMSYAVVIKRLPNQQVPVS